MPHWGNMDCDDDEEEDDEDDAFGKHFDISSQSKFTHCIRCLLRWPSTVSKCLCLIQHYFKTIF